MSIIKNLEWRKIFKDFTSEESISLLLELNKKEVVRFYVGIDPTAPNMHIGHLLPIMASKLIYDEFGFKPIFVIGGFTATIGDPSGKNIERPLIDQELVKQNVEGIKKTIEDIVDKLEIPKSDYLIVNNKDHFASMSIIDYFRLYGKNFNLNKLLSKEQVQKRIDTGISFTEFSYQTFQAIDFLKLNEEHNCFIQIGGSDQWGNIVTGIDLIRKMSNNPKQELANGITTNLLLDRNGDKIGKSQGNPMWINEDLVSGYQFHQYFLNLDDQTASMLLRNITLITKESYEHTLLMHEKEPWKKHIQNTLSEKFISKMYSKDSYEKAIMITDHLFQRNYDNLTQDDIKSLYQTITSFEYQDNVEIIPFLIENKIIASKREANEFIATGAIKLNNVSIKDINEIFQTKHQYTILDIGKKKKFILKKVNKESFEHFQPLT